MQPDRTTIARRMRTTIPRCIAGFVVKPAKRPEPWEGEDIAVWRIACPCGSEHVSFLGYPLSKYNKKYSGSAFVGPLAVECAKCGRTSELFDTNQHGYHAEASGSPTHICGKGKRKAFICPHCGSSQFEILTSFFFWPASMDLVEDEPETFESRAQDMFCEFAAHGRCQKCREVVRFTDFGKL